MKASIGGLVLVALIALLYYIITSSVTNLYNNESKKYKEKIGTEIILNKDTLLIIDYSVFNENFELSNGNKISFELVEKIQAQ